MTITAFRFCDCMQCFRKKWKRGITSYFKTVWKTASYQRDIDEKRKEVSNNILNGWEGMESREQVTVGWEVTRVTKTLEGGLRREEMVEKRLLVLKKEGWFFFFFIIERTGFYLQIRRQRKRREETVRQEGPQSAWICTIFPPTRWLSQTITEQEGSGEPAERWKHTESREQETVERSLFVAELGGMRKKGVRWGEGGRREVAKVSEIQGEQSRTRVLLCDSWRFHWMYMHFLTQVTLFFTGNCIHQHYKKI